MQATTGINQIFLDNMTRLWRHDPRLAQQLDEVQPEATLAMQPSRKGPMTAVVTAQDGRKLFLHSRYDPEQEALEFCKSLQKSEAYCVVLSGLGLGYHVKALFETFGDEIIVFVTEPDLVTIKTALEHTDLSAELESGHVEILTSLAKTTLHERLGRHATMLMLGTLLAAPSVARDVNSDFHNACRQAILDYAAFAKMSLLTLVRNSGITCRNIANNLPTYVCTPPADVVRRAFVGCPAILVAAGPSLSRNIDQLRSLQGQAVIIAAQTTLRPLLSRGIRPHFVTSLDFSDLSRQFFENVDIPEDLVLVAEPKASWHVVDAFRRTQAMCGRRVILLDNVFAQRCVGEALAKRTPMEAGSTVMHLAFYLAQWLGCDPIIFVGQDLAFTGHCYYTPGVPIHRAWWPELGRYCTLEMKEWMRIVRQREILRKIKDIDGRDIYTDEQMFTYLEQFERDFGKCAARIIDATEGGARKAGATTMTLADAARQYCRGPLDQSRFGYLRRPWYDASKLSPARDMLASRKEELAAFRAICTETRELLHELEGLLDEPERFNRLIVRVDELRTLVQRHGVVFRMVRDVSQLGELQKFAADRRLAMDLGRKGAPSRGWPTESRAATGSRRAEDRASSRLRAERQLQRDRLLVESLLEGCDILENIIDESLARFDQAKQATDEVHCSDQR
ncbi:MAG TPA: 6-hydroxymethylpterin diphosphokinase MptE-like protein [Phycisphaerae bacterium]|nr:6-hydroxymethylpterin diphosphokinase MptE-like protein [Phycisphaerae bacterium]